MSTLNALTFLAPNLFDVYQFMMTYLGERLGYSIELKVGTNYDDVLDCDLAFICGLPYVLYTQPYYTPAKLEALIAPVLKGERFQNRPIYFSDVIVKHDSLFKTFADLRGCSWAYNEPFSQSGYGITRYHLLQMGETGGFFGDVVESGFHEASIRMVCRGEVDASAIDAQVLLCELHQHPELAQQLRIIGSLGASTIQPLVGAYHLPNSLKQDIRTILTQLHTDDEAKSHLNKGFIRRWVTVNDSDYDDIRQMLDACERHDFLMLR